MAERRKPKFVIQRDVVGCGPGIFVPERVAYFTSEVSQGSPFLFHGREKRMRQLSGGNCYQYTAKIFKPYRGPAGRPLPAVKTRPALMIPAQNRAERSL